MNNRKNTASCLSKILNEALIKKFGKIPSANTFANQFNLRAYGTKTITRETARKWLLGLAVPEIDKLVVLVDWLEINVLELFSKDLNQKHHVNGSHIPNGSDVDSHINDCLKDLSDSSKNAILLASWMMKQLEQSEFNFEVCEKLIKDQLSSCSICNQKFTKLL